MDFLVSELSRPGFWVGVGQIIGVNIILSGDNAVVIALACMRLPPRQRMWGMILGAGVAVLLRVFFTLVVSQAMTYPYLKLVGSILLFWVALKLVVEDEAAGEGKIESAENLWRAVRVVAIADIVMSLDNVLAIAGAADRATIGLDIDRQAAVKTGLIIFGLATSIPMIIAGSALLMALLDRFRILVWAGGALLGWVAGDILITDPALVGWIGEPAVHALHPWAGRLGAMLVVCLGLILLRRHRPLVTEDLLALVGLLIWLAGDIVIDYVILEDQALRRWAARGAIVLLLIFGYAATRSRRRPLGAEEDV